MKKNSNSLRIIRLLNRKNKKYSAREISNSLKIPINHIQGHLKVHLVLGSVKKESLNGHWSYFWIPREKKNYIRKSIIKCVGEEDESPVDRN